MEKINLVFGTNLCLSLIMCVLGYMEQSVKCGDKPVEILRCLYQARKTITWKWLDIGPPTITDWLRMVNNTIIREKLAYRRRGGKSRFEKLSIDGNLRIDV